MRLATGLACTVAAGLALTPLLPRDAAGQTAPGASSSAAGSPPATSSLCPAPTISAINTETSPGSGVYTGPPAGPKGVWVQISGSNLVDPACQKAVLVGTVRQPNDQPTPGPITPPSPTASPSPSPSSSPTPTPSPSAPAPGTETIYFPSNGDSGAVSVQFTDPSSSGAPVVSNNNLTFLSPPVITGMSTQTPSESEFIALAGTGFTAGGLNPITGVTYYRGPATSQVGCDADAALITDDTHITLNAPSTYCSGDAVLTFETQLDTRYPISSNNMNIIEVPTPQPIQVRGVVSSILPKQPTQGTTIYVMGSGFGTSGTATLNHLQLLVSSWNDRVVALDVPSNASSGPLLLSRYDGTSVPAGSLTLAPLVLGSPSLAAAEAAAAAAAAKSAVKPPVIFNLPVPPGRPISGGETVIGQLNPAPSLTPFISNISYVTTPVAFSAFGILAAIVLAAAFILGFLQAARLFLYARRSRRLAALAGHIAVDRVALAMHRRGRELRLGRHVRNVEIVGRSTRLGHLLLRSGVIDRHALREGLRQHRAEGRALGQVLVARGAASEVAVWSVLGDQWGITLGDLDSHWVDIEVAQRLTALDSIKHQMLPVRAIGNTAVVAMADPFDTRARLHAERCLGLRVVPILATPSAIRRRQERVYSKALLDESVEALRRAQPEASAHLLLTGRQRIAAAVGIVVGLSLAVILGGPFFIGVAGCVVALYAVVVVFRTYVMVRGGKFRGVVAVSREELDALTELPIYTILCPLYREAGVLPQLVEACAAFDYPASLLDVKLLLEADDTETLEVVRNYPLPGYFDVIVVPAEGPRTKPKACNYGLQFARGEYVVIFDAEDIPEPDQLKKAIATFRASDPSVGCVQAKLNFYNPRQNALTTWFALEYTAWFDFFLPGLVDLGLPVPLGGSSNHFPTSLLRQLNAWDPNNVTEDADLGIRLHRAGYRTVIMDSTTLEEANSDFVNWVKQRSRWGKGYAISWLVQMRHPVALYRAVGLKSFIAVQLTLGGTFGVSVLNLAVWLLTLLWALAQFNFIAYLFPSAIYYVGMLELLVGNFFFLYMGVWSCQHRQSWELTRVALLAPAYWLMMSLAMLKAALQLVTKPTYWEKTVHGLFEHPPESHDVELVGSATAGGGAVVGEVAEEPVSAEASGQKS